MGRIEGAGVWGAEAWRVRLLAGELGVVLDDEALILCDVYDLRALQARLRASLVEPSHTPPILRLPYKRVASWIGRVAREGGL